MLEYVYPKVVDWRRVFADLKAKGIALARVADLLGKQPSTVERWVKDGVEPRHSIANAILELHTKHCGADATQARLREASPRF